MDVIASEKGVTLSEDEQKKVAEAVTEGIRKYIEESAVRSVADKEI